VSVRADTAGSATEFGCNLDDGNIFCHESFQAFVFLVCPLRLLGGHVLLSSVATRHQTNAKLNTGANVNLLHIHAKPSFRPMADYRVYLIGPDGHFWDVIALVCADDAEAVDRAKQLTAGRPAELWQLDRKVAILPAGLN